MGSARTKSVEAATVSRWYTGPYLAVNNFSKDSANRGYISIYQVEIDVSYRALYFASDHNRIFVH